MKERRYVVVITDSSGAMVRRLAVGSHRIFAVLGVASVVVLGSLVLLVHAIVNRDAALQSVEIQQRNTEITSTLTELEARLPETRKLALRTKMTFAQVWSKSGLGPEARLLGAGPVEEPEGFGPSTSSQYSDVIDSDPVALPIEMARIEHDGRELQDKLIALAEYFNDAKRLLSNTPSIRPSNSPWLTSGFGRRQDPVHGGWVMHKGIDIGGFTGMEVSAPSDGVVIYVGSRGGYGRTIVIDHGYGLQTHYAHLSGYQVKTGDRIKRGDVIGQMGSTGKSTGPHLHYEVRRMGEPVDPRPYILDSPPDWSPDHLPGTSVSWQK